MRNGATYDPGTQGALSSIRFDADIYEYAGYHISYGPALSQNGKFYYFAFASTNGWSHAHIESVVAANFRTAVDPEDHPDFSATGSPIQFGFVSTMNADCSSTGYCCAGTDGGVDNWSVTVDPGNPGVPNAISGSLHERSYDQVDASATDCPCFHDFRERALWPTGATPTSVAIADLDGDGDRDLAVADRYAPAVSILKNTGAGTFLPKTDFPTGAGVTWVAIADLNHNGRPDLVTADQDANTMSVLLDDGSGGFGAPVPYSTGDGPTSLAIDDFDHDGDADVVVANLLSSSVSVRLGIGDGTFGPRTDFPTANGAFSVAAFQLNSDGNTDLVVACVNADRVSVLLGNGNGMFDPKTDYVTGSWPFSVAIADLTGDTIPDVAVSNANAASVSIFPGDGTGAFLPRTDFPTGAGPTRVVFGEMVGSHLDLVISNYDDQTVSLLAGDGAGGFAAKVDLPAGPSLQSLAVGDLNGDGDPDIAAVSYETNTVSVLLNCSEILDVPGTQAPTELSLGLATPNPGVGRMRVPFALPIATRVQVRVLDVLGRSVAKLTDGFLPAGRHNAMWDGTEKGVTVPAGIYFVRLEANGKTHTRQVVRLK